MSRNNEGQLGRNSTPRSSGAVRVVAGLLSLAAVTGVAACAPKQVKGAASPAGVTKSAPANASQQKPNPTKDKSVALLEAADLLRTSTPAFSSNIRQVFAGVQESLTNGNNNVGGATELTDPATGALDGCQVSTFLPASQTELLVYNMTVKYDRVQSCTEEDSGDIVNSVSIKLAQFAGAAAMNPTTATPDILYDFELQRPAGQGSAEQWTLDVKGVDEQQHQWEDAFQASGAQVPGARNLSTLTELKEVVSQASNMAQDAMPPTPALHLGVAEPVAA